ncbi:hypothetical protein NBH00_21980 [Paraconexibacter antarcticus]|uniref:Uncharacterized protein n=1 Tax=Paraconexibacter antarcticus TaxID=2949664 RepID=A0ABY5DSD6_9ACTN|nr:hypothetical protein [Paraconexibacter antarcticus]UTI63997.1 hypothetical protein NBH00_21980 [Paraconexibacter antarcticus]
MAQMPLYATAMSIRRCLQAAGGDLALTLLAFAAARVLVRRRALRWTSFALLLMLAAILVERQALSGGRWSYAASMPTLAGMGIVPLVQLPLIAAPVVLVATRASRTPRAATPG